MEDWMYEHEKVLKDVLKYINSKTDDFVLKGGTALKQCYNLNRFSEDIDFDSNNKDIEKYIKDFCEKNGYTYNKKKDTETTKRFMVNYGNDEKPLKVEVSYRKKNLDQINRETINGIEVYDIDTIATLKSVAYSNRNKIRDLHDICYIINNFYDRLTDESKFQLQETLLTKGLDNYDYLVMNNDDPLIDTDKLLEDFLTAWDRIGLETSQDEKTKYNIERPEVELKSNNYIDHLISLAGKEIKNVASKLSFNKGNKDDPER